MKQRFLSTTLGTISCLWLALAQAVTPSPQFLGTWEMDISKTQPQPQVAPKSVTVTIKDAGGGKWSREMVVEMADGTKQTDPTTAVSLDGTPSPIPGETAYSLVVSFTDPSTATVTVRRDGQPVSTETYKLSADGKQMVHTLDRTGPDGPFHMTQTFNKKK